MRNLMKLFILILGLVSLSHSYGRASDCIANPTCNYGINPPLLPIPKSSCCPFAYVDFLYWQMRSEGLIYAYTGNYQGLPTQTVYEEGHAVRPHFQPGVRAGIGFALPCHDAWDFAADYVYFHSRATDSAAAPGPVTGNGNSPGPFLMPAFINLNFAPKAQSAKAAYHLTVHEIDVELGRSFYVGRQLTVHPHAGFKGSHMYHDYDVTYFGLIGAGGLSLAFSRSHNTIDFWGAGLVTGLDTTWNFWRCLSLVANSSLSLLWSHSDYKLHERTSVGTLRTSVDSAARFFVPVLELFIGLSWDTVICKCMTLNVHVGWEEQYFFNLLQFNRFGCASNATATFRDASSLALGGLTAGLGLAY